MSPSPNASLAPPVSGIPCPVCRRPLQLRPARGRKSGKPFLMLVCPHDGRHFRAFISDKQYIARVFDLLGDPPTDEGVLR